MLHRVVWGFLSLSSFRTFCFGVKTSLSKKQDQHASWCLTEVVRRWGWCCKAQWRRDYQARVSPCIRFSKLSPIWTDTFLSRLLVGSRYPSEHSSNYAIFSVMKSRLSLFPKQGLKTVTFFMNYFVGSLLITFEFVVSPAITLSWA